MKSVLSKVMRHPDLINKPPVLVDVGASGNLPSQWRLIAPYSICVAFDADTREFNLAEDESSGYKKLFSLNRLVDSKSSEEIDFFLTASPYCSSSLQPNQSALKSWAFWKLFEVEKTIKLPAIDINSALASTGVDYIDWYKTDTQGTDLRIFDALPSETVKKIIVAEFEPGIIDAYLGEDKLHQVMAYMEKRPFWVTQMNIKGSQRISNDDLSEMNTIQRKGIASFLKMAPGWCEISYLNTFERREPNVRDFLLGWVFSTIKQEHGFALSLARIGHASFGDDLFFDLIASSKKLLSEGYLKMTLSTIRKLGRMAQGSR